MPRLHEAIHPRQSDAPMPFAPGILVTGGKILFISGCTALNLYHSHPHRPEELVFPEDTSEQARRVLRTRAGRLERSVQSDLVMRSRA